MRLTGRISLLAAVLLTAAATSPEQAPSQVPDAFDVRTSGFEPANPRFDTKDVLMTASTGWIAPRGMPASFVGCPRPSPYMFGSNPGMFRYGWYMSPLDVRFSRAWFHPVSPWYPWFTGWGGRPGFGYGSYWRGAGLGAWGTWPASGMCGPGSASSAFFFGAGGFGYGGYAGLGGYGGFGGFGSGYPGYGGYWGFSGYGGGFPGSPSADGGLGRDTGSGYIPESVRQAKGFRVIESRPTTGGADLRRTELGLFERWFEQFEPDTESVRSARRATRDPIGDAAARGRAAEQTSRESISDAIARARGAAPTRGSARTGSAKTRAAPSTSKPARTAPARTGASSSKPARTAAPRSSSSPAPSSSTRSAPKSSPKSTATRSRAPRQ